MFVQNVSCITTWYHLCDNHLLLQFALQAMLRTLSWSSSFCSVSLSQQECWCTHRMQRTDGAWVLFTTCRTFICWLTCLYMSTNQSWIHRARLTLLSSPQKRQGLSEYRNPKTPTVCFVVIACHCWAGTSGFLLLHLLWPRVATRRCLSCSHKWLACHHAYMMLILLCFALHHGQSASQKGNCTGLLSSC